MSQPECIKAVVARADELDSGHPDCLDPADPQGSEFWEQGVAAFRRDIRLEDCPYDAGPNQDDWLRGWMAAELIEFGKFEETSAQQPKTSP